MPGRDLVSRRRDQAGTQLGRPDSPAGRTVNGWLWLVGLQLRGPLVLFQETSEDRNHREGPSSLIFEFFPYQEGPGFQIDSSESLKLVAGLFNVDPEIGPFDMDDFAHFVEART
jgi:hypothetical protein